MAGTTVILGNGAIGRQVTELLTARGDRVRVAQRRPPEGDGVEFAPCDVLDAAAVRRAVAGASQLVLAIGFPYDWRIWQDAWPRAMTNVVEAAAEAGARVVFLDNLYQLGPQTRPRTEDMPLTDQGRKPAILAEVTRIWMRARDRVRFAAVRCPDFYGPGVRTSHLGEVALGYLARGRRVQMYAPLDVPHAYAYAPDIARAIVTLLDAPDDAFGQAWNVPCAPTRTAREMLQLGADAAGHPLRLTAVPWSLLPVASLFDRLAKEMLDVGFTFDRPYEVDSSPFQRRFAFEPTPFERGVPDTVRWFQQSA